MLSLDPDVLSLNLPENVVSYKNICEKMLAILEEEEECIKTMNVTFIKELIQKKQDVFFAYKLELENILNKDIFLTFTPSVKNFIKNCNDQVLKKIEENVLLLKIESSVLREFFKDIMKQCEAPKATYGRHKKLPFMQSSLTVKEL